MKRIACLVLLLSFYAAAAAGETLKETSFTELGFKGFQVEGTNQVDCTQVYFNEEPETVKAGETLIASLHVSLQPVAERFDVNVFLNRGDAALATANERSLRGEWIRVGLPAAELRQKNELRVCAKTSYSTTKIAVLGDSLVGKYRAADFSKADSFTMTPATGTPVAGDEFTLTARARNYGGEAARVDFSYRAQGLEDKLPEIVVLKGTTEAQQALVPPCQAYAAEGACATPGEREFVYWVKATEATKMTLLPAVLSYANAFGERESLESNRPGIEVSSPKVKVKPFILSDKEIVKVWQTYSGRVALKNTGLTGLKNVKLTLRVDPGLTLEGNDVKEFEFIPAQGTAYMDVKVRADAPGSYVLGCEAVYQEVRLRFAECEPVTISVEPDEFNPALLVALGLVAVAGLAYIYINRS